MKKPISASSAIACRWRISALVPSRDDAVHDLLETVRAGVVLVRPQPAVHEERRRPLDPAGEPLLATRLDPPSVAPARHTGVERIAVEAEAAREVAEIAARALGLAAPAALREEEGVGHPPILPLLAG